MAYLNKFNNQEAMNNYTYSQEYSEPFVGYTADPYELVQYNITDVMVVVTSSGAKIKVPVTTAKVIEGRESTSCPTYNNEYLQPFISDGTKLPEHFCVVPQTTNNNTVYQIYEQISGTEIAAEPMNGTSPEALIMRSEGTALKPENYYKLFEIVYNTHR